MKACFDEQIDFSADQTDDSAPEESFGMSDDGWRFDSGESATDRALLAYCATVGL